MEEQSITNYMGQLKQGDDQAVRPIWEHFFGRLVEYARNRMNGISRQVVDEEDVALSVLKSVCMGMRSGRFHDLESRESLWKMLVVICGRKIANEHAFQNRAKRDRTRLVSSDPDELVELVVSQEPTPEMAAVFSENLQSLLRLLEREDLVEVAISKMTGNSNEEIARERNCSISTVERKLKSIRTIWKSENEYGV